MEVSSWSANSQRMLPSWHAVSCSVFPFEPFVLLHACRYPLLKGDSDIVQLLKLLKPKVLIPLLNAGTLEESGQLTPIMSVKGSSAAAVLRQRLAEAGLAGTKLEYPAPPGESLAVAL